MGLHAMFEAIGPPAASTATMGTTHSGASPKATVYPYQLGLGVICKAPASPRASADAQSGRRRHIQIAQRRLLELREVAWGFCVLCVETP
jgi:hypothetical protein